VTPFAQGAGRVDVARAVSQPLTVDPPSLSLGVQRWPHADDPVTARTVTYYNAGNTPVTLAVAADMTGPDGKDAPTRMFTFSATAIVVPAGGQTAITLTADTRVAGPDGQYIGRVVATGGDVYVGTPVAVEREAESYDLAVSAIGRDGKPPSSFSATVHPGGDLIDEDGDGTATIRLPRGEYAVTSIIDTGAESPTSSSEEGTHAAPIDAAPGEDERTITPAGFFRFQLPMTRTEFYTTDGLQWLTPFTQYRAADGQPELTGGATWRTYRRDTYQDRWGVGVLGPSVPKPDFPGRWVPRATCPYARTLPTPKEPA
jgi:hypothetical protein